jgi:enoyl-CoA hydratase
MSDDISGVSISIRDFVAEITLSRPDDRNSITFPVMERMIGLFEDIEKRDDVRAVVIAAEGKSFSAGGDFDMILSLHESEAERQRLDAVTRRYFAALVDCPHPVVAAVQGDAIGAGATMALCSDAVVCSRTARIADPHVLVGLAAGDGGTVLWPHLAGLLRARRYLLTGDRLSAEDAYAFGLVTDLVDAPAEALPAARALAARIAALPPLAVKATKKALVEGLRRRIDEVFEVALALELETFASADVVEAIGAAREHRNATFQGH